AAREGALGDLTGVRVGVITELGGEGYDAGVMLSFNQAVEQLKALGAEVVEVSCPNFKYALSAYYLIAPSECSSNLARFDAMRYGLRVGDNGQNSAEEVMSLTREAGFGAEVKRRIMLGTYALSAGYYDAYYGSAQKVRTLIKRDFAADLRADQINTPLLIQGAENNSLANMELRSYLRARDVPVELVSYPGETHIFHQVGDGGDVQRDQLARQARLVDRHDPPGHPVNRPHEHCLSDPSGFVGGSGYCPPP
ncbi:amidase family protein, partial [Kibdelosporangium lantanae]